ncbi:hypothetical protein DL95DRAFT_393832 [Leptodontidium sp. 2 PMI_412]|nr:hypothetical protein DL95DRAFT_393832 [Leptodontidium sp. 2 PMI_412]
MRPAPKVGPEGSAERIPHLTLTGIMYGLIIKSYKLLLPYVACVSFLEANKQRLAA